MAPILRRLIPILLPFAINWFRKRQQSKRLAGGPSGQGGTFGQKPGEQNVSGPFRTGGR